MTLQTTTSGTATVSGTVKIEDSAGSDTTGGDISADGLTAASLQGLDIRTFLYAFNNTTLDRLRSGGDNADDIAAVATGVLKVISRLALYIPGSSDYDRATGSTVTTEDDNNIDSVKALDVRAFLYGRNTNANNRADILRCDGDDVDAMETSGGGIQRVLSHICGLNDAGTFDRIKSDGNDADGVSESTLGVLKVLAHEMLYDAGNDNFSRKRSAHNVTLLTSAARTATVQSATQTNYNMRGAIFVVDVTAITATPSVTFGLQMQDPVSSAWVTVFTGDTAATAASTQYIYYVYPGIDEATTDQRNLPLPVTWRINMTHADTDSITYSVGACLLL